MNIYFNFYYYYDSSPINIWTQQAYTNKQKKMCKIMTLLCVTINYINLLLAVPQKIASAKLKNF